MDTQVLSLLQETANQVESLERRRTRLLHEVNQVEKDLLAVKARHGKLVNQAAPVSKLPHEILSDIFQLCYGTEVMFSRTVHKPFEIVASHVSTHWRSVVLGTPLLWNNINLHITNRTKSQALQRLSAHLTRSDRSLLDISLHVGVVDDIQGVLTYFTPHAHRWRRVSISIPRGPVEDLYAPFHALKTPNLIHLSLRIGNSEDEADSPRTHYPQTCPLILTQGCPSLNFVRVAGKVVGNLSPPLSTTQTLHIDAWPRNLMNLEQFYSLLESLPCLVHLSLTGLTIQLSRDPFQTSKPIPLPTLRSLRIRGNATPCHRLLSLLSLPHLESLFLQGVETFDSITIPSLLSLTLDSVALSQNDLQNVLKAFPRVRKLDIDDSSPGIYPLLTPEVSSSINLQWPELRSVTLRRIRRADVAPFYQLCRSRLDRGSPFQYICLDRRSRNILKLMEIFLVELCRMQPIENADEFIPWPAGLGYDDPDDAWY